MSGRWRVGRTLGRTLYWQHGEEPSKQDTFVGIVDSQVVADQIVDGMNRLAGLRGQVQGLEDPGCRRVVGGCHCRRSDALRDVLNLIDRGTP